MGIDLELFFNIKKNGNNKFEILKNILKGRGIETYKVTGNILDIEYPEPSVDYSTLPPEKRLDAECEDLKRPAATAVYCYGIFNFIVHRRFVYASMKDRWSMFFSHKHNRQHDLECAIEAARNFTDRFYLVPDESDYHCFSSSNITQADLTAVFRHPELVIVHMSPDIMKMSLEDAAKNVSYRTNNKLLKNKIKNFC